MDLDTLCKALSEELERDPKGPRVADLLATYATSGEADWRDFALFDEACYSRNLVLCCESYELLLLCWAAGQVSPIHNHAGQRCWMACLDGDIEETHFREVQGAPPEPGSKRVFQPGQVAFISDEIALHQIRPQNGHPGVSLHLYSKPIRECNVYCDRTGRVERKQMAYHSIRGVLQPQA